MERLTGLGFTPSFTEVLNGALSIKQIAALEGLKTGRDLAERERNKDQKKKIQQRQQQANQSKPSRQSNVESFD